MRRRVGGGPWPTKPLGRAMFSSRSLTCWPDMAMKKTMSTNTTSTIGAI